MYRRLFLPLLVLLLAAAPARPADVFDRYTNPVLAKAAAAPGVKEIRQLTPSLIADAEGVLPDRAGALVVVRTNEGRSSKLIVQSARQKVKDKAVPILLIDRFVTYREGEERTIQAQGQNVHLFEGFQFNLDLGQVVPPSLGGDLRLVVEGRKVYAEPLGNAKMYLVTKALPLPETKATTPAVIGEPFEPRYFNGTYKLYDDGRRSGTLTLKVSDQGDVTGEFFSDKDGRRYEVAGKVGTPRHAIQFTIKFPRTKEAFQGWMFTGDGKAIAGSSRLEDREAGFYALRVNP
jgi:hypothetical protein